MSRGVHEKSVVQRSVTWREQEVLSWVAEGKANKEIAQILCISPRTVKKHLEIIFKKLGVENRTCAALYYAAIKRRTRKHY